MEQHRKIYFLLLFYFGIVLATMFVYQNGFFIIKDVLPDISESSEFSKPQSNKVVLVIIDALRFDFTQKFQENKDGTPLEYFKNQLTFIHQKMEKEPNNTIHLVGYCDPPTATTQRIKAITIGNLPSFIEIAATFTFSQREEDTLLLQMKKNNLEVVHLGDDVWTGLFGKYFTRDFFADSLDIFDFHTTDNLVIKHLEEELKQPNLKLLIAHFNGVDHVGHALNSNHEQMSKKLSQMNEQIEKIVNLLNDDDVMILMGDHGMSEEGHHGGSTPEETTSVIFGYSKRGFEKIKDINSYDPSYTKQTNQIDILSTISMLLGIPIPYNNLGMIITDFYPKDTPISTIFNNVHYNLKQIYNNIVKVQTLSAKMTDQQYLFICNKYDDMETLFTKIQSEDNKVEQEKLQHEYIIKAKQFQSEIKEICRLAWNQLNINLMLVGNVNFVLCVALCLAMFIYLYVLSKHMDQSKLGGPLNSISFPIISVAAFIFSFIGIQILFDISFGTLLGFFLIPVQISCMYFIFNDIQRIKKGVLKKQEHNLLILPVNLISRRSLNFFIYSAFLGYTMNSLHSVRTEDLDSYLFIKLDMMIWYSLTIGVIVDLTSLYSKRKLANLTSYYKLIIIPIILYLVQYFDVTTSRIYVLAQTRFDIVRWIMSFLTGPNVFFPAVTLFLYMSKKKVFSVRKNEVFYLINYLLVTFYFVLQEHNNNKLVNQLNIYVPRIVYILLIVNAILIQRNKLNYSATQLMYAHIININIPLLMIINKHSFYLCLAFHIVFDIYTDFALENGFGIDITYYAFFLSLIQYFYLISGHKSEITSLQVQSAYVGFEKFNHFISGYLLTANQYSFQLLGFFMVKYLSKQIGEKKEKFVNEKGYTRISNQMKPQNIQFKSLKIKEMSDYCCFMFYLLLMITSTSINCTYNHDSLFMPSEFGPRFLFDSIQILHALVHIIIILFFTNFIL